MLIGLDDLSDPDAGTIGLQAAISAARARWLARNSTVARIVTRPDAQPIDLGRTHHERHHAKVHHGFRIPRVPHGRWHTYRPDDTEIRNGAPLLH